MQAWDIAKEVVGNVLANFGVAIKITTPVYLISIVLIFLLGYDFWLALISGGKFAAIIFLINPVNQLRIVYIPVLVLFIGASMVAIAWHRYIVLGQQPKSVFSDIKLLRIWAYSWRLLLLWMVVSILFSWLLNIVTNIIVTKTTGTGGFDIDTYLAREVGSMSFDPQTMLFYWALGVIGAMISGYIVLRLSPVLVAVAIDRPIGIRAGWKSTSQISSSVFLMAVAYTLIMLGMNFVANWTTAYNWPIQFAITLIIHWALLMYSSSLFTVLYQKGTAQDQQSARLQE